MRASPRLLCRGGGKGLGPGRCRGCSSVALGHPQNQRLPGCVFPCRGQVSCSGTVGAPQGRQRVVLNPIVSLGELLAGQREPSVQPQGVRNPM